MLVKRVETSDETSRTQLLKKIRELACLESTSLMEPQVKTNNKGRPPKSKEKVDTSTKRDPSKFEYAQFIQDSPSLVLFEVYVSQGSQWRGRGRGKGRGKAGYGIGKPKGTSIPYVDSFNPLFLLFIREVVDVETDVNCGFMAIAGFLGFGEGQWARVRKDLLIDLQTHLAMYAKLFRLNERVDEVTHMLDYNGGNCTCRYWLAFPDMGYLVASGYNCVIHLLGKYQSLTFLPLRVAPIGDKERKVIAMAHVNGNHFVQVYLHPGYPFPPVCSDWYKYCCPAVRPWVALYQDHINSYKTLVEETWERNELISLDSE